MFAIERKRIIKDYIQKNLQVEVSNLSLMLNVSEVTIRRDLEKLEEDGYLTRTHGGAVLNQKKEYENLLVEEGNTLNYHEISDIAVRMIGDGDIIMLTNGTINRFIAKKLSNKNNITVLTNDIMIATQLSPEKNIKTILLGGALDARSNSVFGTLTIETLEKFFVTKLFMEVDGVTKDLILTVSSLDMASLIQQASKNASESIILFTAEAFSKNSFYCVGDMEELGEKVITNSSISNHHKSIICNRNIQLFTSINAFEEHI